MLIVLVLYSRTESEWKIADFGLSAEGSSKRENTTRYARGTDGYRAPELMQAPCTFNNKVDIWGLGCIAYEILTHKKAFQSDWETIQYTLRGGNPLLAIPDLESYWMGWPYVRPFILAMLDLESWRRPSASAVINLLRADEFSTDHVIMEHNRETNEWRVHKLQHLPFMPGRVTGWSANWFSLFEYSNTQYCL
jgi:serine/threonine protein kinase